MKKSTTVQLLIMLCAAMVFPALAAGDIVGPAGLNESPTGDINLNGEVTKAKDLISVTVPTKIAFVVVTDEDGNLVSRVSSGEDSGWAAGQDVKTGIITATNGQIINNSDFPVEVTVANTVERDVEDPENPDTILPKLLDRMELAVVPVQYNTTPPSVTAEQDNVIDKYKLINGAGVATPLFTGLQKDQIGKQDDWFLWIYGRALSGEADTAIPDGNHTIAVTLKVERISEPTP